MNKGLLVLCMIITAVAAVGVIFIMILGLNGYSVFSLSPGWDFQIGSGNTVLLKEESVSMQDIRRLSLETGSFAVSVKSTTGDTAKIRQYGDENTHQEELLSVRSEGENLSIKTGSHNYVGIFIMSWSDRRIELDIPEKWLGDVDIRTSSGGVRIIDSFQWEDVSLAVSSGGVTLESRLDASSLDLRSTSGGIKMNGDVTVNGRLAVKTSSGGIRSDRTIMADTAEFTATSGGVRMDNTGITSNSINVESSSGGVNIGSVMTDTFDIRTTSGGMRINDLSGYGNIKCSSGGMRIETLRPTGNIGINSSSGSITIGLPQDMPFKLDARVSSGSIRSDYQLWFSDDRNKHATATNGQDPFPEVIPDINISASSGGITVNKR